MFCGRELTRLPTDEVDEEATLLYLNENKLETLADLSLCRKVTLVIADDNLLTECLQLPHLPELHTLSLNKNQIKNVHVLCEELNTKAPKLVFLSILGNPCCPDNIYNRLHHLRHASNDIFSSQESDFDSFNEFTSNTQNKAFTRDATSTPILTTVDDSSDIMDEFDYSLYRLRVIYRLPNLQFLDSSPITNEERAQAQRHGLYLDNPSLTGSMKQPAGVSPNTGWKGWSRKRVSDFMGKPLRDWLPTSSSKEATVTESLSAEKEPAKPSRSEEMDEESQATVCEENLNNSEFTPLPSSKEPVITAPKAAYGKCRYVYYGKHSEGNRFITNYDL